MKDRFGSEIHVGDMVATDALEGPWLYALVTNLIKDDDEMCEVQFTDTVYDKYDGSDNTLFSEDVILCTEKDIKTYTFSLFVDNKLSDLSIDIDAMSLEQAKCIVKDILEYP